MPGGIRTIILVPLIPHIDHSRPISTQFCYFLESPILAYFCQNPPRGQFHIFRKPPFCSTPNYLAPIGTCASKFEHPCREFRAKPLYESQVIHFSVRKPNNLAKSRGVVFSVTNEYVCKKRFCILCMYKIFVLWYYNLITSY